MASPVAANRAGTGCTKTGRIPASARAMKASVRLRATPFDPACEVLWCPRVFTTRAERKAEEIHASSFVVVRVVQELAVRARSARAGCMHVVSHVEGPSSGQP